LKHDCGVEPGISNNNFKIPGTRTKTTNQARSLPGENVVLDLFWSFLSSAVAVFAILSLCWGIRLPAKLEKQKEYSFEFQNTAVLLFFWLMVKRESKGRGRRRSYVLFSEVSTKKIKSFSSSLDDLFCKIGRL
jgi:hypothetical protein